MRELHRSAVKQKLNSWGGCTQGRKCPRTHDRRTDYRSLGQTYLLVLEGLLGVGVALAHCGDKDSGSGNMHQHELSRRLSFWYQDLPPLNNLQCLMLECLRLNSQQGGDIDPSIRK